MVRAEPEPTAREFGQMMMRKRLRKRLTKHQVGQKIGVSGTTIGNWEDGMTVPYLNNAVAWAESLGFDFWPIEAH